MPTGKSRQDPPFMRPGVFITGSVFVGVLFAMHDWISMRHMGHAPPVSLYLEAWAAQFFLLGSMCWLLWRFGREYIENATLLTGLIVFLPLSVLVGTVEEMIWVLIFTDLPRPGMPYWNRLSYVLNADLFESIVIFWCAFFLFRGIGYYQRYRENEQTASQLQVQLANAQLSALRMQMNPHFLFNTMNSISSLMRIDIEAADLMLEQLSSLMRITLERGDAQLISLRDELEFVDLFLEMQGRRYAGRVSQTVHVDPGLYDCMIPAMLLQPIIENAYVHGLSTVEADGHLTIHISRNNGCLRIQVTNSGRGLMPNPQQIGHGMGLGNTRNRLRLHYGDDASLTIGELGNGEVRVIISLPQQLFGQTQQPFAECREQ